MFKIFNSKRFKNAINICAIIFFILALFLTASILGEDDGIPNIGGIGYLAVQSNSMIPEFQKGDLIVVNTTDVGEVFNVGDIVTFNSIIDGQKVLNTHQIIKVEYIGGTRYYTTKGTNSPFEDNTKIISGDIVALYRGTNIRFVGFVIDYINSSMGFLIFVLVPLLIIFIYNLFIFINIFAGTDFKNMKNIDKIDLKNLTDKEKKMLEEIIKKTSNE